MNTCEPNVWQALALHAAALDTTPGSLKRFAALAKGMGKGYVWSCGAFMTWRQSLGIVDYGLTFTSQRERQYANEQYHSMLREKRG